MATKQNPGKFDCYNAAEPDEPMFTLLGRDPAACICVMLWIKIREYLGETSPEKLEEAHACAEAMRKYLVENRGKGVKYRLALEALGSLLLPKVS